MQAVSYLAPALAPLAIKIIDRYIFDDQPSAPVPQIIQIPASPQCGCRCGREFTDDYDTTDGTCSTCTTNSSSSSSYYHTKRHRLSTKLSTRSSSTGDPYRTNSHDKEHFKASQRSRSARRLSDGTAGKSEKKSDKHSSGDGDTLHILAANLKKEISARHSKGKSSSRGSESRSTEKSSSARSKSHSSLRKSSGKSLRESASTSRKSANDSDGSRLSKAGCNGC